MGEERRGEGTIDVHLAKRRVRKDGEHHKDQHEGEKEVQNAVARVPQCGHNCSITKHTEL
jgi:hypothetical protein